MVEVILISPVLEISKIYAVISPVLEISKIYAVQDAFFHGTMPFDRLWTKAFRIEVLHNWQDATEMSVYSILSDMCVYFPCAASMLHVYCMHVAWNFELVQTLGHVPVPSPLINPCASKCPDLCPEAAKAMNWVTLMQISGDYIYSNLLAAGSPHVTTLCEYQLMESWCFHCNVHVPMHTPVGNSATNYGRVIL